MKLETTFDRVVVLTLARRDDRWTSFLERFPSDWPFAQPERVIAVDGNKVNNPPSYGFGSGAWGCLQSHMRVIEECLNRGQQSILFIEDDAVFDKNFRPKVERFFEHLPPDWDGVMLGGQHLGRPSPPVTINPFVLRVMNGNRTHCHGMRGSFLQRVYHHLCVPTNHVDHMLGQLHPSANVYSPAGGWIVGQVNGHSNILGKESDEMWWNTWANPSVAVIGPYRSGTSCIAGVLTVLGVHMGIRFLPPNKNNPTGFWEAMKLQSICRNCYLEPHLAKTAKRPEIVNKLRNWKASQRAAALKKGTVIGGKHPILSLMTSELLEAWGKDTRFIVVERPVAQAAESLIRTGWMPSRCCLPAVDALRCECRKFMASADKSQYLLVQYHDILKDPERWVGNIIDFLGLEPNDDQIRGAVDFVEPKPRRS